MDDTEGSRESTSGAYRPCRRDVDVARSPAMDTIEFWNLIDGAQVEADDPADAEQVVDLVVARLSRRPVEEIVSAAQTL
jgi:hypothetical protein